MGSYEREWCDDGGQWQVMQEGKGKGMPGREQTEAAAAAGGGGRDEEHAREEEAAGRSGGGSCASQIPRTRERRCRVRFAAADDGEVLHWLCEALGQAAAR